MRLLFASLAAVTVVAFAAPSFAQDTTADTTSTAPAAPAVKHVKHHKTTMAKSCSALKSQSAKSACLKRQHAHAAKPHKPTKKMAAKSTRADQLAPPVNERTPAAQPAPPQSQSIAVPPLPQKTL